MVELPDRIFDKIMFEPNTGCWLWTGATNTRGYGRVYGPDGRLAGAHRLVYALLHGPIAPGLTLDHLCHVRLCVNPAHLEPVTLRENLRRGESFAGQQARQTHCKRGHAFDSTNTHIQPRRNGAERRCRTCDRDAHRRRRAAAKRGRVAA